jgi:hypothetical protein
MIHAEWKERVPGKWFLVPRERTIEIEARHMGEVMRQAQRRFPGAQITMRSMPARHTAEVKA